MSEEREICCAQCGKLFHETALLRIGSWRNWSGPFCSACAEGKTIVANSRVSPFKVYVGQRDLVDACELFAKIDNYVCADAVLHEAVQSAWPSQTLVHSSTVAREVVRDAVETTITDMIAEIAAAKLARDRITALESQLADADHLLAIERYAHAATKTVANRVEAMVVANARLQGEIDRLTVENAAATRFVFWNVDGDKGHVAYSGGDNARWLVQSDNGPESGYTRNEAIAEAERRAEGR